MYRKHLAAITLAALGFSMAAPSAKALTYATNDLLLGFYDSNNAGAGSLVVNIGSAATYRDYTGDNFALSIGDLGADLAAVFGSGWKTDATIKWGVFGDTRNVAVGSDGTNTLYATREQTIVGTQATPWKRGASGTQSQVTTRIESVGQLFNRNPDDFTTGFGPAASTTNAMLQPSSVANDFAEFQTNNGNISFAYFNIALGDFGDGTSNSRIDLFRMATGSSTLDGTYEGTFVLNDSGTVFFGSTPNFTPVPEPSVYGAATVLALAAFVIARRRRAAAQA